MNDFFLKFDGSTGYVDTGKQFSTDLVNGFSISFWAKIDDGRQSGFHDFCGASTSVEGKDNRFYIRINPGGSIEAMFLVDTSAISYETAAGFLPDGPVDWKHFVAVFKKLSADPEDHSGRILFYCDDVFIGQGNIGSCEWAAAAVLSNLLIGAESYNGVAGYFLACSLDDFRLYAKALTQDEITAINNNGRGTKYTGAAAEGGVAAFALNMDEGFGQIVTDAVSGTLQGTLHGGVGFIEGGVPLDVDDPVIELIAKNLETSINAITVANGYNQTLKALRTRRNDFTDCTYDDLTVLIKQADEEQGQNPIAVQDWEQPFLLMAAVIDSDTATAAMDTRINQVRADIQKKLLIDVTRGGNAYDTVILPSREFDNGAGFSGIAVNITVKYRTAYTNPYAKG